MADAAAMNMQAPKGPLSDVAGQIHGTELPGYGACDPLFRDSPSALLPYRFSTGLIKLTRNGATGNLTAAAAAQIQLFSYGVGEDPAPAGFPAGGPAADADLTDCFGSGTPVDLGQMFVVTGLCVNVARPYDFELATFKSFVPWSDNGGYDARAREAVLMDLLIEFTYGNTACKYRLGNPGHWADMGGPTGPVVSNGRPTAGVYLPLRAATVINARDQSRKLTVNIRVGSLGIALLQDAIVPTVSDLFVPVQMKLMGYPICAVDGSACPTPGISQAQVDLAVARALGKA